MNYMLNPFQTTFSSFFLYYPAHIVFSKKINASEQESTADLTPLYFLFKELGSSCASTGERSRESQY